MTRTELYDAFRAALKDDGVLSDEEKQALATQWASLLHGARSDSGGGSAVTSPSCRSLSGVTPGTRGRW